ncbi:MAG TPA: hypothetical protein VFL28_15650 [bacterium]|nr:hypothetical protein [bacterium]
MAWLVWTPVSARGQLIPAGFSAAVLSFVDAAAGRVEVVRHWPDAPVDVSVYPYVPYFWSGCPGVGAVMILVTAPGRIDHGSSVVPDDPIAVAAGNRLAEAVRRGSMGPVDTPELRQVVSGLRAPGDPIFEAAKSLAPAIADLRTYERRGYAVFAFVVWQGWRCGVVVRAVPEGYGIPFVR